MVGSVKRPDLGSEAPCDLSKNASLHQGVGQFVRGVKLGMERSQKVLTDHAEFNRLCWPPAQARVDPRVSWYRSVPSISQVSDVIDRAIPLQVVGQVQKRARLELILRRIGYPFCLSGVLGSWIGKQVQVDRAVATADFPAGCDVPGREQFAAVRVGLGAIAKEEWQ